MHWKCTTRILTPVFKYRKNYIRSFHRDFPCLTVDKGHLVEASFFKLVDIYSICVIKTKIRAKNIFFFLLKWIFGSSPFTWNPKARNAYQTIHCLLWILSEHFRTMITYSPSCFNLNWMIWTRTLCSYNRTAVRSTQHMSHSKSDMGMVNSRESKLNFRYLTSTVFSLWGFHKSQMYANWPWNIVLPKYIYRLRDQQFKVDSERQIFWEAFHGNFILFSEFLTKICLEEIAEEIFFVFCFDVCPGSRILAFRLISQHTTY